LSEACDDVQRRLRRSERNLSLLVEVTRALGVIDDVDVLIKLILNAAIRVADAEKGSLMLVDDRSGELVLHTIQGLADPALEGRINTGQVACRRFRAGDGIAGQVLAKGQLLRRHDVLNDDLFEDPDASHVQSIVCVPLKVNNSVIGVINITNQRSSGGVGPEDEALLEALASQAAVAIARTRLYETTITDGLTNLYTRSFALHRLHDETQKARRYGTPVSIIMCDIDHFRRVNNSHGHPAGDKVLRAIATAIKSEVRQDVDIASRYGGEEFILILPQTDENGAALLAERLRASVAKTEVELPDGARPHVTMSCGVATFDPGQDPGIDTLIERADAALYRSKDAGRNRVTVTMKRVHPAQGGTRRVPADY
jgi:diguanylate cyclase (GGDEF)-like protein